MPAYLFVLLLLLLSCSAPATKPCLSTSDSTGKVSSYQPVLTSDSAVLAKYIWETKLQYVDTDKTFTEDQVDSILQEAHTHIQDPQCIYTRDSLLKIFSVWVEHCGGYCNRGQVAWIHYKSLVKNVPDGELGDLEKIYMLPDNNYLLIERSSHRRPPSVIEECLRAHIISLPGDSLIIEPVIFRNTDQTRICQLDIEGDFFVKYDSLTHVLSYNYNYSESYVDFPEVDSLITGITGQLRYKEGRFIHEKELIKTRKNRN